MMHLTYSKNNSSSRRRCVRSRKVAVFAALLILILFAPMLVASPQHDVGVALGKIDRLLQDGNWEKARAALERIPESLHDNYWSLLYALSDQDGMKSYVALKQLLARDPAPPVSCRAVEGLAEFHLMRKNYALGLAQIDEHLANCPAEQSHGRLYALKGKLLLEVKMPEEAAAAFKNSLAENNSARTNAESVLALGDAHDQKGDYAEADYAYTRVTQTLNGNYDQIALERLRSTRSKAGDSSSVATLDKLLSQPERKNSESRGERTTQAARFAIRLGQFASRDEAEQLLSRFKENGYTVSLNETSIAGNTLYAVDLGRFDSALSATRFMQKLQRQTNATYQVVSL